VLVAQDLLGDLQARHRNDRLGKGVSEHVRMRSDAGILSDTAQHGGKGVVV
jgi:hypothetical protein